MMNRLMLGMILTVAAFCQVTFAADAALPTPPQVWKDFDPDKGDYKEQIVKEETRDGIRYRDTYISAYVNDQEIRVYCMYGVKDGASKAPGLLNVHGWMSMANIPNDFVKDGWAVMAFDYCGKTGTREQYTKYPDALRHCNMDAKEGGGWIRSKLPDGSSITDPKQTTDYVAYAIQRRVLSYMLTQKEVDPARIGAQGYSYGGTIMWNLGMDRRVKAIVAYFGVGWNDYYRDKQVWMYNQPYREPEMTSGEKLYLASLAPEAHAPYITAASLWLNGSNDHHGGHERGETTFKQFSPNVPWAFAHHPRGHHDTGALGDDGKLWLQKYVLGTNLDWPAHPRSEIKLDSNGVPQLRVTPAAPGDVVELKAFYALKEPASFARVWRDVELQRQGDTWAGAMPVLNVDDYVFGFANIRYKNNVVLSTDFNAVIPSKLGPAVATDKKSDVISDGRGLWTDVAPVEGVGGVQGFRPLNNDRGTATEQFHDPKWQAPRGAALNFQFYCTQPQALVIVADDRFEADFDVTASDKWQTLTLTATQLKGKNGGGTLGAWADVRTVRIKPRPGADITKVIFGGFKWVSVDPKSAAAVANPPSKDGKVYLIPAMASVLESLNHASEDKSWDRNAISVGGKTYERGIGVHAPSRIIVPLSGRFATFHVVPGPDDEHRGVLEMKILLDDKEVFTTGKVQGQEFAAKAVDIPLAGAKTVTLVVTEGGNGNGGCHASWADAYFVEATAQAK